MKNQQQYEGYHWDHHYRLIMKSRCSWVNWSTGRSVATLQLHVATVGRNVGPSTCRTLWYFLTCPRTSILLSHMLASSANIILGFLGIFHPGKFEPKSLPHDSRTLCRCNFDPLPLWQLNPNQGKKELGPGQEPVVASEGHAPRFGFPLKLFGAILFQCFIMISFVFSCDYFDSSISLSLVCYVPIEPAVAIKHVWISMIA